MTYRVVQWATGNVGMRSLREVIRDGRLELAGVLVYGEDKVGVDAGTLCGEPDTGVLTTRDPSEIVALAADCVLYMPRQLELDEVIALLEAGTNVVTTRTEFADGGAPLGEDQARVLAACESGGASVYGTGSSPGWITDALPLTLVGMQRRLDRIDISEHGNMSQRDSPDLLFALMGFGQPPETFDAERAQYLLGGYGPALRAIGEAAGRPIESWTTEAAVAVARRDTTIAAGQIAAGTVAAQRMRAVGSDSQGEVLSFATNWYCTTELDPDWDDLRPTGWRVEVHGDAPLTVELPFPVALEDLGSVTPGYTANPAVNAIPYVIAAAPGILRTLDLPMMTPAGPRSS